MVLHVREATTADVFYIAEKEAATFPVPWSVDAILSHLASQSGRAFLLFAGDTPIGYLLGLVLSCEGEVLRVAVEPSYRGQGAGGFLLRHFFSYLKERGSEACFLEVRRSNLHAQAVYQTLGFSFVGERKKYYQNPCEDALVMRRPL